MTLPSSPQRATAAVRRRVAGAALRSEGWVWRPDRRTVALGLLAAATTAAVVAVEVGRIWRRGPAPLPSETDEPLIAAQEAVSETAEAAVVGYQESSSRANATFNLLTSFVLTFVGIRTITWTLRGRDSIGPFRDVIVGRRHIHHFVPGIVLAFTSGAVAILTRNEDLEPMLAIPFGAGMGLTLDESALLLELEDVYWSREGLLGVQITLAVAALIGALSLGVRFIRRGEHIVLEDRVNWPGPERPPGAAAGPAPLPS
ncbi:MAG: hypothetical protein M3340_07600 [Actinomycetota bacterium]|nr:hypothetical protein [Actinomycetota bacterium]